MNQILSYATLCATSFFTLINPIAIMPIFLTMTADFPHEVRLKTARKAMFTSLLLLLVFAITGQFLFAFFGISVNSLKIVGGIIFFLIGQDMLQARLGKIKITEKEIHKYVQDISITPLAIPMICGPGAITNAIVLMEQAKTMPLQATLIVMICIICLVTYLILANASKIYPLLGETGNNVLMRLMGLILMVIAVEFFFSGLKPILRDILKI